MPRFTIQTEQSFGVTYEVDDVATPEEAWQAIIDPGTQVECSFQSPGDIIGSFEDAVITEDDD